MKNKFTKEDKSKYIEFLNFVSEYAEFDVCKKTKTMLKYIELLNYMQKMLVKIDANIFEVVKVNEVEKSEE